MAFQNTNGQSYALISTYGIYEPEVYRKIVKKYPTPNALNWLRSLDRVNLRSPRISRQMTYTFYEEGNYFNSVCTIESNVPNGVTATHVDITIEEADHFNSGAGSWPIPGDLAVFTNEVVGYVQSVDRTSASNHVVTISPLVTGDDVNAAAVNTEKISFFSSAEGERSDAPETRVPQVTGFTNGMQIIRESYEVTDVENKSNIYMNVDGETKLWVKGLQESVDRFKLKEQLALLISKRGDGTSTDPDSGNEIFTTEGLIPDLRTNGTNIQYADPIDLAKWDEITTTLDQVYGDREYLFGLGLPVYQKIQAFMDTLGDAGSKGITFNAFEQGGMEQALSLNLKSLHYVGYDFHFDKWDILSHRDSLGADGMPFKDLGVGCPMGSSKNPVQSDGTAEYEPHIQCTYFESPLAGAQMNGEFSVWETGAGASTGATDAVATRQIHHYMIKGLELRNKDKFVLLHL